MILVLHKIRRPLCSIKDHFLLLSCCALIGILLLYLLIDAYHYLIDILYIGPFLFILQQNFLQALMSSVISCVVGLGIARIIFYNPSLKIGKILHYIAPLYFVMPSLMIILCMIGLYGNNGLLNKLLLGVHIGPIKNLIYGYHGVIFAHVFINFPLALWVISQAYNNIAHEYWRLGKHLQFTPWQQWYIIEWPLIKKSVLASAILIFYYCFMSFAIVLVLGGGHVKTFELSIYQAYYQEFNPQKAAFLGIIQFCCLLPLVFFIHKETFSFASKAPVDFKQKPSIKGFFIQLPVLLISFFYVLPVIWFIGQLFSKFSVAVFTNVIFWQSVGTSLILSLASVLISFLLAIGLIYQSSFHLLKSMLQKMYDMLPLFFIALPPFLLLSAYFSLKGNFNPPLLTMIIIQSLLLLPLIYRMLQQNFVQSFHYYHAIMRGCRLSFWHKILIMVRGNKSSTKKALGFGAALSLGDFSIIALLGNENVTTIPYYLYANISHYKFDTAIFIGLILILLQLLCFLLCIEKKTSTHAANS